MAHALSIENLTKTYTNGFQALKGVSLSVQEGDFYALLGPNGAGKSTTIGIICSLVTKSAGTVRIFDKDIDDDFSSAKRSLGLVPQEFNFNVFEPVEEILVNQAGYFGIDRTIAFQRAERFLKQLGLWEKRRSQARDLSGGMKRRLMIARALVHSPPLILADEPTGNLDKHTGSAISDLLFDLHDNLGSTLVLVTHDESLAMRCDRQLRLDGGSLVEGRAHALSA